MDAGKENNCVSKLSEGAGRSMNLCFPVSSCHGKSRKEGKETEQNHHCGLKAELICGIAGLGCEDNNADDGRGCGVLSGTGQGQSEKTGIVRGEVIRILSA